MYIRTKDGVYLVDEERETYFIKLSKNGFENYVPREKVLNQSENLEELCDEFVIDNPNDWNDIKKPFVYENIRKRLFEEHSIEFRKNHNITLYGAIWTSKGLIYVAKMDDKGELELI